MKKKHVVCVVRKADLDPVFVERYKRRIFRICSSGDIEFLFSANELKKAGVSC